MPYTDSNGFTVYYETEGEGFPLVFIHGGFGGLGTGLLPETIPHRDRFAGHFKVITYDRRAAGRSSYPDGGFTMENLARDLREVLRHLGLERAHVWGSSAGGLIALAFGLQYPEAAASLVITDSAPWLSQDEEMKDKLRARIRLLREKGPEAAYEARATEGPVGPNLFIGRPAHSEQDKAQRDVALERTRAQLQGIPRSERIAKYAGELRNYSAYVDWDATPRLQDLRPPVLVLHGEYDTIFPIVAFHTMTRLIPKAEYKMFDGAEHGVTRRPEAIDLVLSFLKRETPGLTS